MYDCLLLMRSHRFVLQKYILSTGARCEHVGSCENGRKRLSFACPPSRFSSVHRSF